MVNRTARLAALLFIAACSNSHTEPDKEIGTRYDVTESGIVQSALDVHDGSFVAPVAVSRDWLAMKPDPSGPSVYLPAGDHPLDLSYYHFGRSGLAYPLHSTPVGIEIAGLDHWHTGNDLQFISPNVGLSIHNVDTHFAYPVEGSTTITNQHMNWAAAASPLIESAKGDALWAAQMTQVSSSVNYSVLTHAGVAQGLDIADGKPSVVRATLAPVAMTRTFNLHWRSAPFANLAAQAGPYASAAPVAVISVLTLPALLAQNNNFAHASYAYLPSLVDVDPVLASRDVDQTIAFGNPFENAGSRWTDFVRVRYAMPVRIPGVGAIMAVYLQATPIDALGDAALAPAISPVRNVKVNGLAANTEQSGVGPTPAISWDAPATGSATSYAVILRAIVPNGASLTIAPAGTLYTRSTSLTLPASATRGVPSYVVTNTATAEKD